MGPTETKIYIAILIAVAVIGVFLVFFIFTILRQQKSNFSLYTSKIQAEILTLEKERSRVSRDLHDDFAPLLLAVKYNINSVEPTGDYEQRALLKSNEILDGMIARVREIANDLMPDALLRKGLITAVDETIRQINAGATLNVRFNHSRIPELNHERSVSLCIIQELLHNTIKHAQAEQLIIDMKADDRLLYITAEDNGRGFDYPVRAKDITGLGLRSMLSRTDIMHGSMYLDSKAGKGTRYSFEIPL